MNRCDLSETNFKVNKNDKYSIRMLQPAGIQAKVGAIASHHYIDIEKDLGNNKKCLMTLGLRTENAKRAGHIGITRYLGTELLSPDFADAKCTGLMNKCKRRCKDSGCQQKCEEEKGGCFGANIYILNSNDKIFRGTIRPNYTNNKNYHNLNTYQVKIVNWFLDNMSLVNDGRSTPSYIANLPFTFSFTPDFCSFRDWGPKEYYNCQKFVSVFHNNAERIWNVLKKHDGRMHREEKNTLESVTQGEGGWYTEEGHTYADLGMGGGRKKRRRKTRRKSRRKKSRRKRKSRRRKSRRKKK